MIVVNASLASLVRARRRGLALLAFLILPAASASVAFAQQTGGGGGAPAAPAAPVTAPQAPTYPGGVAAPPPGQPVGGGNSTTSSSRPIRGDEHDTFDLGPARGSGGSAYGGADGPIFTTNTQLGRSDAAGVHVVRKGDTLWAICDSYFHNPYQWPRIWSYNAQIQNPHWIYPNDVVRLRPGAQQAFVTQPGAPAQNGSLIDRRRQVPPDTIFLRDEGFIDDSTTLNWGEISGAREDKLFMTNFDEVYLRIGGDHDVKIGQELTVFRSIRAVAGGNVIQLQGTVRVDQWNEKERVARAQVVEALDVIERGARIGPVTRRFEVVPPLRNNVDLRASVLSSVTPHPFYGQNQVIFIDKGDVEGLRPGNRLFIVRRGDAYHQSVVAGGAARRIAIESNSPAEVERVPRRDDSVYPEEVVGELRVLATRPHTATAMVTRSTREIEQEDVAVARKGY